MHLKGVSPEDCFWREFCAYSAQNRYRLQSAWLWWQYERRYRVSSWWRRSTWPFAWEWQPEVKLTLTLSFWKKADQTRNVNWGPDQKQCPLEGRRIKTHNYRDVQWFPRQWEAWVEEWSDRPWRNDRLQWGWWSDPKSWGDRWRSRWRYETKGAAEWVEVVTDQRELGGMI